MKEHNLLLGLVVISIICALVTHDATPLALFGTMYVAYVVTRR